MFPLAHYSHQLYVRLLLIHKLIFFDLAQIYHTLNALFALKRICKFEVLIVKLMLFLNTEKVKTNRRNDRYGFIMCRFRAKFLMFMDYFVRRNLIVIRLMIRLGFLITFDGPVKACGWSFSVLVIILKGSLVYVYLVRNVIFLFFGYVFDNWFGCRVIQLAKFSWLYRIDKHLHLW